MTYADTPLPEFLQKIVTGFVGRGREADVTARLRSPDDCMTPKALSAYKSSRTSFARILARRMIDERWRIERKFFNCDAEGLGLGRYEITAGQHRFIYASRPYRWDGIEKVGRRSEGAKRDMTGAMFIGMPDEERIAEEIRTFDYRDWDLMRTDSTVAGWTPGSRSARFFDLVVDTLADGRQPDPAVIGQASGYLVRNGGYLACGRFGTLAYEGYPASHPLRHPYFPDLFGLFMVRQVSIELVNGIAAARSAKAVSLAPEMARYLGVGNSSGQGMCVALQRWPHWVSTWIVVRELSIAYAKSMPVGAEKARWERMAMWLRRCAAYYRNTIPTTAEFIVPHPQVAANLELMRNWTIEAARNAPTMRWGDLMARAARSFDRESLEQIHSLLIETYGEFADAAADYLPIGSERERDVVPEMRVGALRDLLRQNYAWALRHDLSLSRARQHFWYHSVDSGEQRRGERVIDPHEEFESFIDHIGLIQRLSSVLDSYDDDATVAEPITDAPELGFAVSRVQYLAGLPFTEIRGNLVDKDFLPSDLIRFMLAVFGMECTTPLSIRQVRGVFFQGMPLIDEIARGADPDWVFPEQPRLHEPELAAE
ncbi:MAG: hypothetical protein FJX35_07450 [Alphaproteobacteria bacterium]|nr:hypothetical protein [Alphaproteobacteria bacterium]